MSVSVSNARDAEQAYLLGVDRLLRMLAVTSALPGSTRVRSTAYRRIKRNVWERFVERDYDARDT
jgi:hypothetical protein